MITQVTIRNFKRFNKVRVELGNPVVFIGPNNSGKTSALQALAFWDIGLKRWNEKRKGKKTPEKRPGVTINRRDLVALPVPYANILWRNSHVRDVKIIDGKPQTKNIRIDIIVEGVSEDKTWRCGLEFDYANEESFYCRPLRLSEVINSDRMEIPEEAGNVQIAFLPPMSGLASNETRLDSGAISVRIGEGRTAEVLRNLCFIIHEENKERWEDLTGHIKSLFKMELGVPKYVPERGEIMMNYNERRSLLDISSSGRGLQQTLLLLAYMYANPGAVLLIDEPDAHLEILRQREIYQLLTDVARENKNQIIAASHSEIILNEAADRDVVVAFLGKPHRIDDRGSQVLKSLRDIGFDQYYQAEQTGWVLYLEGSTDLAILRAFAETLQHTESIRALERPFIHYVGNQPGEVRKHFHGLREARSDLKGIAIFDRLEVDLPDDLGAEGLTWKRREIENYLCYPEALVAYAGASGEEVSPGPLFTASEVEHRKEVMVEVFKKYVPPAALENREDRWWSDVKASDDFLDRVFEDYFTQLKLPNLMRKSDYHQLAYFVPKNLLEGEISDKLNAIVKIARSAKPTEGTT